MLIVCPSCASEYTVDPERLGANGRTVRCAACRMTWVVEPATEAEPSEQVETQAAAEWTGEPESGAGPIASFEGVPAPAPSSIEPELISVQAETHRVEAAPEAEITSLPTRSRRTLGIARSSGRVASRWGDRATLWLAFLTTAIGITAVLARAPLVRLWPEMATLYAMAGLPVNLSGLDLQGVKAEFFLSGADAILVIEGDILNPTGRDLAVPRIEFAVRGADGQPLYTWTNDAPRRTLGPTETARFHAKLASPPA
jgi:predicted Zn finger-like uncharacterized protein